MSATPNTLPDWTLVAFTGHRALDNTEATARGIAAALDRLTQIRAPLAAISSAASGSDTLFLEEARRRGIPATILLPFERERFRRDFNDADWARVDSLMRSALHVEELAETESATAAYLETGIRGIERADVLIAVWDGKAARGEGGTGEIVDYARQGGKPLLIVNPDTGAVSEERIGKLPAAPHATSASGASVSGAEATEATPRAQVKRHFRNLDAIASRDRPRARQVFSRIVLLHLAAEAAAVVPLVFVWAGAKEIAFGVLEIALLGTALFLVLTHKRVHHEWIVTRMGAELCRSFLAFWSLHRAGTAPPRILSDDIARLHRSLTIAWYQDTSEPKDLEDAREEYRRNRVDDQLAYFRAQLERVRPRLRTLRAIAITATVVAIVAGVTEIVLSLLAVPEPTVRVPKLIAALLPLVNAAVLSYAVAEDYARRALRYSEMIELLESTARRIARTRTWLGLTDLATELESRLFQEVTEWHSVSLFSGDSH